MKNLLVIGAGGCGREVMQWVEDINKITPTWNIKGYLDDNLDALNGLRSNYKIIDTEKGYAPHTNDVFVCAIGNSAVRKGVIERVEAKGGEFVSVTHPSAIVANTAELGKGVIVYPFALVSDNAVIGDGCIINMYSSIDHDSVLGEYCTISAHCDVTGTCTLGDRVFMGTSSNIVPSSKIGDDVYICAGSTVMTRIRGGMKVLGNPAKIVKF